MNVYARVENGVVTNLYWAEAPVGSDLLVTSQCREGWAFNGSSFVQPAAEITAEKNQEFTAKLSDKIQRMLFELFYDQEIRIRALAVQPVVTKVQYRSGLQTLWRSL